MGQVTEAINSIITKVQSIPYTWPAGTDVSVPGKLFQWVAIWNNQVRLWETGSSFPAQTPCCFIETDLGKAALMGLGITLYKEVKIIFHIVDWQVDAGDGTLDQNLEVFTWRDLLKTNMELFFPLHCGAMVTINEEQDYNHTGVYHYIITFKTSFSDLQGSVLNPDQQTVILTPPPTLPDNQWGFNPTINIDDQSSWPPSPDPPTPPVPGGGGPSSGDSGGPPETGGFTLS